MSISLIHKFGCLAKCVSGILVIAGSSFQALKNSNISVFAFSPHFLSIYKDETHPGFIFKGICEPSDFRDLSININEFSCLCRNLFRNEHGKPYHVRENFFSVGKNCLWELFLATDGQRADQRDLPDLQRLRGRKHEHPGVCALLEQVDQKGDKKS